MSQTNIDIENQSFEERLLDTTRAAAQRYKADESERKKIQEEIEENGIFEAEKKERVDKRKELIAKPDGLGDERIIGETNLIPVNFFLRGYKCGHSVGRIHIHSHRGPFRGWGTGFMVSPSLLMTNQHVLPTYGIAEKSRIEFNHQYDEDFNLMESHIFHLNPRRFYYSDEALDFALVSVESFSTSSANLPLTEFGYLLLHEDSGKALVNERVSIIQHPKGMDKHLAVLDSKILNRVEPHFIHYNTDTDRGSSGSPVFNDNWDVIAIHHSGVPEENSDGELLKKDGSVWQDTEDVELLNWVANEGIRISSIFDHLAEQSWSNSQLNVLEELATHSAGSFNQVVAEKTIRPGVSNKNRSSNKPIKPISYKEFRDLLEKDSTSEEDIAPYYVLTTESSGMDPLFRINKELVIIESEDFRENALLLNAANWISKAWRQRKYHEKKNDAGVTVKIFTEGDSWFQYPLLLNDVVDYLMQEDSFAVMSFGGAGDLIKDMVADREWLTALREEKPDFFLISGGGNDLVEKDGIKRFLREPKNSTQLRRIIDQSALAEFKARLISHYTSFLTTILSASPDTQILCHGYSYPVPNDGQWLGRPMKEMGIIDKQIQSKLMEHIFDVLNDAIKGVVSSFPDSAHFVDVRDVVPINGWYDELHPTNQFYEDVAMAFKEKIMTLSSTK